MAFAHTLMFLRIEPVYTFFTPIVWTTYIIFLDGLLWKYRRTSLFRDRRPWLWRLLPLSIGCWLIFEAYNLRLTNWHYVNLPAAPGLRGFGYAWAFATIFPGIFLTAEFIALRWKADIWRPLDRKIAINYSSIILGMVLLIIPLAVPKHMSSYFSAMVWLGFIFLLDPINARWTGRSVIGHLREGNTPILWSLLLAGVTCGLLWEFWNYWARTKWIYNVPFLPNIKLFEMPVLGYLGFPAFAVECYVMYDFWTTVIARLSQVGRPKAFVPDHRLVARSPQGASAHCEPQRGSVLGARAPGQAKAWPPRGMQ